MTDDEKSKKSVIEPPTLKLAPGDLLPDIEGFDVQGIQGEGGMAKVYLAKDLGLDRLVAIKMISSQLGADPDFRTRFRNEAQIVAKFRHPNIVRVYAGGEKDDAPYIVMELVGGDNLKDRLRSGALDVAEAIDVARQMADALCYSHSRDVIHRDFKPANILFTEDNTPVLSDFGVAKSALPEPNPLTAVGVVIGSLPYMSPEQSRAEPITNRIDIYSFGRVLYEMLTGDLPPRRMTDVEIEAQVRTDIGKFSPELADLVCDCLSPDPDRRPSAEECRDRLDVIRQSILVDEEVVEESGSRSKMIVVGLAVFVPVAILTLAALGKPPFPPDNPLRALLTPSQEAAPATANHYFDTDPPWMTLYVDDEKIDGFANLAAGRHNVVAVEPNHYGKIVEIEVGSGPVETAIKLERLQLPTDEELGRFISAIESPQVSPGDLQRVAEKSLRQALDIKRLADSGAQEELAKLEGRLDVLRSYDDPSSAVTLYLAAESGYLERDSAGLLPALQTAMNSGYALATFWYAARLRDALAADIVVLDDPVFLQYCEAMQLAHDQGFTDVAARYLETECSFDR
ncbi:MAG: serine/threonine protein kinase [Gammaproteobacteria bacterium]|nr:serine/threonine protein kinase [Gammaproteobacteria bacterium]